MRTVIIGGSSQSTPVLFKYLSKFQDQVELQFTLAGRNKKNLEAVARASRMLLNRHAVTVDIALMGEEEYFAALEAARLVVVQVRIGGYAGRAYDETFPLQYGFPGDEGLGLGGLSAAWRAWPVIREIVAQTCKAAPQALILMLSSPVGLLVRTCCLAFESQNLIGLCELPWTTLLHVCQVLDQAVQEVSFDYYGLHHLGWFYRLEATGRDLVGEYTVALGDHIEFPSAGLIRTYSGIPTRYLRLHFEKDAVLEEQHGLLLPRGILLEQIRHEVMLAYQYGSMDQVEAALYRREAPWYPYALGPLILGLAGMQIDQPFFISRPYLGLAASMGCEEVMEAAFRIEHGALVHIPNQDSVPQLIKDLILEFMGTERMAAQALYENSYERLGDAISNHPWCVKDEDIENILKDIKTGMRITG